MNEIPAPIQILLALTITHFAIDIALQSDFVAINKNRHKNKSPVPWCYVMLSHVSMHTIGVWLVTENTTLALTELALHFAIDVAKCEELTGIHQDQALHILCKAAYAYILFQGTFG